MTNEPIKRLNYFPGQYLDAEDFTAEQNYHMVLRRRSNQALYFITGILEGLQVTSKENDLGVIIISPGIAIDGKGRELILLDQLESALPTGTAGKKRVRLRYAEVPTDEQVADRYIRDNTRFELKPEVWYDDTTVETPRVVGSGEDISLAIIEVDANGKAVGSPNTTEMARWAAKAQMQGDLYIGDGESGALRTRYIEGIGVDRFVSDNLYLNSKSGKDVVIGYGGFAPSSLLVSGNVRVGVFGIPGYASDGSISVTGNIGIGTQSAGSALEIRGPNTVGPAGQREISLSFESGGSARIRAFRGVDWDTSLEFLTTSATSGSDSPAVRLHIGEDGKVGIGVTDPQMNLSLAGGLNIDQQDLNDDGYTRGLRFGSNSGVCIASKRTPTGRGNTNGLDFYTNLLPRLSITRNGNVGIGTSNPREYRLMVTGGPTRIADVGENEPLFGIEKLVGLNSLEFHVDDRGVNEIMRLIPAGLLFTLSGPDSRVGLKNTLTPKNIVKAWAIFELGAQPQVLDGFNIDSVGVDSSGQASVTLKEPLSGPFSIVGNMHTNQPCLLSFDYNPTNLRKIEIYARYFVTSTTDGSRETVNYISRFNFREYSGRISLLVIGSQAN